MCTALHITAKDHYFGRTLDLNRSYGEEVCVMPRNFPLQLRKLEPMNSHDAIIGMAAVVEGIPLFYDGVNEHGLAMAGLNFPGNACYVPPQEGKDNVTPFEFIPWILGQCHNLSQARELLERINLVNIPFSEHLPLSPLHWMICDRDAALVVEAMVDGIHIHENPAGVMTNNPPFEYQMQNLINYRNLRVDNGENSFSKEIPLQTYCQGLGALGLPGDVSSMSRFVRIAFGRANARFEDKEAACVGQFFHLLSSVEMIRGLCKTEEGDWDLTVYTACMNTKQGLYYYTTYENRQISCVDLHHTDLESGELRRYPLITKEQIFAQN